MKYIKEFKSMRGKLMRPISVGKSAVFSSEGLIYHTSVVIALHKRTKHHIHFETQDTHYHLSLQPIPQEKIIPLPIRHASCA